MSISTIMDIENHSERELLSHELISLPRVPRIKTMRRALGLSLEEFSTRYAIPVKTLNDWEAKISEPDEPALAYLHLIATDPSFVAKALLR